MKCPKGHHFDFAKEGYINLLLQGHSTKYDKSLFHARRELNDRTKLYQPVIDCITHILTANGSPALKLLDAGTGEGYILNQVDQQLKEQGIHSDAVGIDIAKDGIRQAAKTYRAIDWVVGDLANVPLTGQQFDGILNVLSPSNYQEFNRLLRPGGQVIKVIPSTHYLKELRERIYNTSDRSQYDNTKVKTLFYQHYPAVQSQILEYIVGLTPTDLALLIDMTPLTWGLNSEERQQLLNHSIDQVTMHFEVLVGQTN
ncbi:hypothetical protein CYJ57_01120 [Falseniella ignava]|uniref:Uncharacterized protein n=2 Tax=Falseniella ignava TaxID=137730 RepID=A0A2I1K4D3_9LACT|nr:methyltransferase domain-containing protein [Falseniella ignava]PKY90493.1 hypothetical protein CYJ57_01120 [Falseniella ignava]